MMNATIVIVSSRISGHALAPTSPTLPSPGGHAEAAEPPGQSEAVQHGGYAVALSAQKPFIATAAAPPPAQLAPTGHTAQSVPVPLGMWKPVPHMVHQVSSAPRGRRTAWECTLCGAGLLLVVVLAILGKG